MYGFHDWFQALFVICLLGPKDVWCSCFNDGKHYVLIVPQVHPYDTDRKYTVSIHGNPNTEVTIHGPWIKESKEVYVIGEETFINLTVSHRNLNAVFGGDSLQDITFRIAAMSPVGVYVHTDEGDGYTAVPKLSKSVTIFDYITTAYAVKAGCRSYVAVAAFQSETTVSGIIRVENGGVAKSGNRELTNGQTFSVTFDGGTVLFIWSSEDLTGTYVRGNAPISVFSGVDCACVPVGRNKCQGLMEQILPKALLGRMPLSVPVFGSTSSITYRAVAGWDNTTFKVVGELEETVLHKIGDFKEWDMMLSRGRNIGANNKFLVVQYLHGGGNHADVWPSMNMVVPHRGFNKVFRIVAMAGFETILIILHNRNTKAQYPIMVNGILVEMKDIYEVSAVYVALKYVVKGGVYNIRSSDNSVEILVYIYGYGNTSSHSFVGACVRNEAEVSTSPPTTSVTASMDEEIASSQGDELMESTRSLTDTTEYDNSALASYVEDHDDTLLTLPSLLSASPMALDSITSLQSESNLESEPVSSSFYQLSALSTVTNMDPYTFLLDTSSDAVTSCISFTDTETSVTTELYLDTHTEHTAQEYTVFGGIETSYSDASTSALVTEPNITETFSRGYTLTDTHRLQTSVPDTTLTSPFATKLVLRNSVMSSANKMCPCAVRSTDSHVLMSRLEAQRSVLTLNTKTLSVQIQRKQSAKDDRVTSKGLGIVGIIVVVLPLVYIIMMDVHMVIKQLT